MPRSVGDTGPRGGEAEGRKKGLPEKTFSPNVAPPPPSATTPKGAREYAESQTVATVSPTGEVSAGPAAGPTKADKQRAKRKARKSLERVTGITKALEFDRHRRAKSYEEDKFSEISSKFFERNPDGTIKTHTVNTPVLKTDENKVKADEAKYRKRIRQLTINGATPQEVKLLHQAAAQKVIENNYVVGKRGKVATEQHKVPTIKPGREKEFQAEVAAAQHDTHKIEEGNKSYYFQSLTGKAQEKAIMGRLAEQHQDSGGGFLGDIYNTVANAPGIKQSREFFDPTHSQSPENIGRGIEYDTAAIGKGIHALNQLFTPSKYEEANIRAAGIPVLSGAADLRRSVFHGIHTGVLTGTEYLTRPGLEIEQGVGALLGTKHASFGQALLHGHNAKNVATGKQISEKLFGGPQAGLLIDFATDPTLWVGAGEIRLATGERMAALTDRLTKAGVDFTGLSKDVNEAMNTGDVGRAMDGLEALAEQHGVSISRLGKTQEDKRAVEAWKSDIAKKAEARVKRDAKLRGDNKYHLQGKSRVENIEEAGRVAKEQEITPGVRVRIGKGHIDIKLPDRVAKNAKSRILPDVSPNTKLRKENYDNLLNLRRSKIDREVFKGFDAEIRDALKAKKEAKTPEAAREAQQNLVDLQRRLHSARSDAAQSISKSALRTPDEAAAVRSTRKLGHELNRMSEANARSVFHRVNQNMQDAMKGLSRKDREVVGAHMAEYADTGGRQISESLYPLTDKQRVALENMKKANYELGRYGVETGTLDNLMRDYAFRDVVKGKSAKAPPINPSYSERAFVKEGVSKGNKHRGYAATAEVTGRERLAEQLQHLSHGDLSREEALKLADQWHSQGKIRTIQEDLAHSVQRGNVVNEAELTKLEKEAYEWGRGRQKVDNASTENLFQDLGKTEGNLKLDSKGAYREHGLEENPFGALTEADALALKHATAQGSLERLRAMRDNAERPEIREDLEHIIQRREAEVNRYKTVRSPERKSVTKINKRIAKLERLAERPGTKGEGAAAEAAAKRLRESAEKLKETEFGDFIPQTASAKYLGSLKDFRDSHPDQFTILDPNLANYHRSLSESVRAAYIGRWKAVDKQYGRNIKDSRLRSPDGKIFYDKKTGEEYMVADPSLFKEAIPEHRVIPSQLHSDLRSEFFRMGENVQKDIFDDANASLFGKFSSMVRFGLTTWFPAYHMRNMISDVSNSLLADPGVLFHPLVNAKMTEGAMLAGKGLARKIDVPGFTEPINIEDYLYMMDSLGLKSQEHLAEFIAGAEKGQLNDPKLWRKFDPGRKGGAGAWALKMSARREDIVRMQTFLQRMRRNGGDAAEASWHTIKYHFDYADITYTEKKFARNLFLFYTWYRKNIPLQFVSLIQKPGFFSALTNTYISLAEGATPLNFNWNKVNPLLPDLSGPVPNSGLIPEYMTKMYASPEINWNGHAVAFSMGLPWADMNLVTSAAESPQEGLREFFNMLAPQWRLGVEGATGINLLTGQKMEGYENNTWSGLLDAVGIKLPKDEEGRPLVPWQVGSLLNNLFPVVGRGAGYLKPPSSVEDQGRFSQLFGGGLGTAFSGVSAYVGPKEGERLVKSQIYKTYERVEQRKVVSESGKSNKEQQADLAKFDSQTEEWAKDNGIPLKVLRAVQGIGPLYVSQSKRNYIKPEQELTGSESGGLLGSESGGLLGGSSGGGLEGTPSQPARKFKSRTEEALSLASEGTQGFNLTGKGAGPSEAAVEAAFKNFKANIKAEKATPKYVAADALHRGKEPAKEILPELPAPKTEGTGKPADVKKAQNSVGNWLKKSPFGKEPASTAIIGINGTRKPPKETDNLAWWAAHPLDKNGNPKKPTKVQVAAANKAIGRHLNDWGLDAAKVGALTKAANKYDVAPELLAAIGKVESGNGTSTLPGVSSGQNSAGAAGPFQIGNGTGAAGDWWHEHMPAKADIYDYNTAAEAAAKYLHEAGATRDPSTWYNAALSYNHADWYAQEVSDIANSAAHLPWDEASGGTVPGPYKVVTSRQQAKTVIHLANKFAGTQEGSKLQQHWAAMSGISGSAAWCSAFISTLMRRVGLPEPAAPAAAGTWQQWNGGKKLDTTDPNALHPGDIITFGTSDPNGDYADHVGLYIGNGEMISGNFGNEVRRGLLTEEERPIQAIVRPKYSGKKVQFKLSTAPTVTSGSVSGTEAPSSAPTSTQAVSGPAAQSTPGYHPGRTKQAQINAAQMRSNIMSGVGTSHRVKGIDFSGLKTTEITDVVKKLREELAKREAADDTSLTARTKRKPKFNFKVK